MDLQLAGKTALVTGGSRGIGRAVATALAREGVRVAVCARNAETLDVAVNEMRAETGGEVIGQVADTSTRESIVALAESAASELGGIDILVNNAATRGAFLPSTVLETITRDDFMAEMDVKVLGYLFAAQALAPAMKESGWGRIINVGGLASVLTGSTVGSIRNVAVAAMTKNLADELGPHGITVNCIHPGVTRPPADEGQAIEPAALANSIKRPIYHADLGSLAAFLASPLSFVLNGAILDGSGGLPRFIRY